MAEQPRNDRVVENIPSEPSPDETRLGEHDRVRASNDRDQDLERHGVQSRHNRGYDEAVAGATSEPDHDTQDIDPDSPESPVERNDESGQME